MMHCLLVWRRARRRRGVFAVTRSTRASIRVGCFLRARGRVMRAAFFLLRWMGFAWRRRWRGVSTASFDRMTAQERGEPFVLRGNKGKMIRNHLKRMAIGLASALLMVSACRQAQSASLPEITEWTWEVRPDRIDQKLPNVLLVGDSITRNYFPEVAHELSGRANVYLFAASTSLGDPRLEMQLKEFAALEGVTFNVVHFSNGMHGWAYSEKEYAASFPGYVATLRKIAPGAHFV